MNGNISSLVNELHLLYAQEKFNECICKAENLQKEIIQELTADTGSEFGKIFYDTLVTEIIQPETCHLISQSSKVMIRVDLVTSILKCIRNSFYKSPSNQNYVSSHSGLLEAVLHFWKFLNMNLQTNFQNSDEEIAIERATAACLTCISNLMANNSEVRTEIWPHLQPHIRDMIMKPHWCESQIACAILHNFLLDDCIRTSIISDNFHDNYIQPLMPKLLKLYLHESQYACFVLFCLQWLLCIDESLVTSWSKSYISGEQILLALDILTSIIQGTSSYKGPKPPLSLIEFLQSKFKRYADDILKLKTKDIKSFYLKFSQVVCRILSLLSVAASSDEFLGSLQKDRSLLITTVYLLRSITEIGDIGDNCFSRLSDTPGNEAVVESAQQEPTFGFKCELMKLIGGLVYRNKSNQDIVQENEGIRFLLENSQLDARNPFIREAAIFTLRNVIEGNEANQKYVSSLKLEGVKRNAVLEQLGLSATLVNGKPVLTQIPR